MYNSIENVREMFRYHPVDNPDRAFKHSENNDAALKFAEVVFSNVNKCDSDIAQTLINQLQYIRMLVNQYITYSDLIKAGVIKERSMLGIESENNLDFLIDNSRE